MGRFILTEEEKSYIQSLYGLNEQTENHTVEEIQTFLNSKAEELNNDGYNCGIVDGKYGPKTAKALSLYLADKKAGKIAPASGQETASDSASAEESEVSKIEKQLNGVSAQEVSDSSKKSSENVMIAKNMKKDSRKDCRIMVANARYSNRKNIPIENSGINKEALSYCLNTYMRRGEEKVKQWAGL